MKLRPAIFSCIALALISTGCTSVSKFSEKAPAKLPETFESTGNSDLKIAETLLRIFDNTELNTIVDQALANNPDLQASQARLDEIGFSLKQSKSSRIPSLSANGFGSRSRGAGDDTTSTLYSASLDASWEVDIWGRVRSGVTAAQADFEAASADLQAAKQSLAAQTMQAWFDLLAATQSLDLNKRSVASFESTESLVNRRFELGSATLAALDLARADLENARANLQSSIDSRDQVARRLRVLVGDYPDASLAAAQWPRLEQTVATGLPSDLLLNRPDVAAAFKRVQAAEARAKVAHREQFPSFILTADGGRQSSELSDLARSAFNSWSTLLNLSLPLIDGGSRRAALNAANKRSEQSYYTYQSTVLNALREVENALGSELFLAREESARLAALKASQSALSRTQRDYEEGITDILTLLETQRRVFTTEQQTINLKAARLSNRVSLALAIGKGA